MYHHYLTDIESKNDNVFLYALKKFQKDNNLNPDGRLGVSTIKALERNNVEKFRLLVINADRWRQDTIERFPESYVWLNLPSFRLQLIEHDTLRLEKRVVIGKPKTPTPILESAIHQIILWPTWTVPQSIIKKEMKSFAGYDVFYRDGRKMVVQPAGPHNALGVVKLNFLNRYSVYIHDTPTKSLFNVDVRAASHGCVRCQDALEVAANILQIDSSAITYDSLVVMKDQKIETRIFRLKQSMPVYFRYLTAAVDTKNNLIFYEDLYKKDKKSIAIIFNQPSFTSGKK
jgi:murein L,D-transpeptidase YcbB/YkuD